MLLNQEPTSAGSDGLVMDIIGCFTPQVPEGSVVKRFYKVQWLLNGSSKLVVSTETEEMVSSLSIFDLYKRHFLPWGSFHKGHKLKMAGEREVRLLFICLLVLCCTKFVI